MESGYNEESGCSGNDDRFSDDHLELGTLSTYLCSRGSKYVCASSIRAGVVNCVFGKQVMALLVQYCFPLRSYWKEYTYPTYPINFSIAQ